MDAAEMYVDVIAIDSFGLFLSSCYYTQGCTVQPVHQFLQICPTFEYFISKTAASNDIHVIYFYMYCKFTYHIYFYSLEGYKCCHSCQLETKQIISYFFI